MDDKPFDRFGGIPFDGTSAALQSAIMANARALEREVMARIREGRSRDQALARMEEAMMWLGKAIRDDQVSRNV